MTPDTRSTLVLLSLLSIAGCKDGNDASADPAAPAKPADIDVAAINAAVPKDLAAAVTFETATLDDDRVLAAVPAGWETGHMPGRYKPARDADLGFFTDFAVGSTCDGTCAPKDWKASADENRFAQFAGGDWEIVADEALASGRFVHAKNKDAGRERHELTLALWKDGASRYVYCSASLEGRAVAAAGAFEKACRAVVVKRWQ